MEQHNGAHRSEDGAGSRAIAIGDRVLGRFVVQKRLGAGGMGIVYEVCNEQTGARYAMKVLRKDKPEIYDQLLRRFQREAKVCAQIKSPHVAQVFDAGQLENGDIYMLMELLEGHTLQGYLRTQPRPSIEDIIDIALQTCAGLAAIHAANIVHRDIKPENIFLCTHGDRWVVKLIDFGIARMIRAEGEPESESSDTKCGGLGTPPYLPPEQVLEPQSADARSDIYALGAVMYRLIAGRHAFRAEHRESLLHDILTVRPRPLSTRCPRMPMILDAIVLRCMHKKREHRYQSAAELAEVLCRVGAQRGRRASDGILVSGETSHQLDAETAHPAVPTDELLRKSRRSEPPGPTPATLLAGDEVPQEPSLVQSYVSHTQPIPLVKRRGYRRVGLWTLIAAAVLATAGVIAYEPELQRVARTSAADADLLSVGPRLVEAIQPSVPGSRAFAARHDQHWLWSSLRRATSFDWKAPTSSGAMLPAASATAHYGSYMEGSVQEPTASSLEWKSTDSDVVASQAGTQTSPGQATDHAGTDLFSDRE